MHILAGTDFFEDLENQKRLIDRIMPYARFLLAENCDCNVFLNYKGFWYNTAIVLPEFEQASRTKNAKERAKLFPVESRIINRCRFTMIVKRATNICIAMRELNIDALCMSKIIRCACAPIAKKMPFYLIWGIVTKVLHFQSEKAL